MAWNDERVELLKKLWAEGLSASQIAARLGGVTRNAVIGKVHRLGLSGRATTSRMKSLRPRPRANVAPNTLLAKRTGKSRFGASGNPVARALFQGDTEPYVSTLEELVIPMGILEWLKETVSQPDLSERAARKRKQSGSGNNTGGASRN